MGSRVHVGLIYGCLTPTLGILAVSIRIGRQTVSYIPASVRNHQWTSQLMCVQGVAHTFT